MVPGDGVEGPFLNGLRGRMISLSVGTSLEKSVQGHLASDSESSAVVESRDHF